LSPCIPLSRSPCPLAICHKTVQGRVLHEKGSSTVHSRLHVLSHTVRSAGQGTNPCLLPRDLEGNVTVQTEQGRTRQYKADKAVQGSTSSSAAQGTGQYLLPATSRGTSHGGRKRPRAGPNDERRQGPNCFLPCAPCGTPSEEYRTQRSWCRVRDYADDARGQPRVEFCYTFLCNYLVERVEDPVVIFWLQQKKKKRKQKKEKKSSNI